MQTKTKRYDHDRIIHMQTYATIHRVHTRMYSQTHMQEAHIGASLS